MEYYLLRKKSDGAIAKLWYKDGIIVFRSDIEMIKYVSQFYMFFDENIELDIQEVTLDEVKCTYYLYSDLVNDEEFNREKEHIEPKFTIYDKENGYATLCDNHTLCFDTLEETQEFFNNFPGFFSCSEEYIVTEELVNRGWYIFMNYKDFLNSDSYIEALEVFGN